MSPRKAGTERTSVNWSAVQSNEYSNKFKKLSSNEKVSSAIETRAKWALNNRDGLKTEEIYAVNMKTGEEIGRITNQNLNSGIERTSDFTKKLEQADLSGDEILILHNHPLGLPPSVGDINSLLKNNNIVGITIGHDGSIYKYTKPNLKINMIDYNVRLRHHNHLSEVENIEQALYDLQEKFKFTVEKL